MFIYILQCITIFYYTILQYFITIYYNQCCLTCLSHSLSIVYITLSFPLAFCVYIYITIISLLNCISELRVQESFVVFRYVSGCFQWQRWPGGERQPEGKGSPSRRVWRRQTLAPSRQMNRRNKSKAFVPRLKHTCCLHHLQTWKAKRRKKSKESFEFKLKSIGSLQQPVLQNIFSVAKPASLPPRAYRPVVLTTGAARQAFMSPWPLMPDLKPEECSH